MIEGPTRASPEFVKMSQASAISLGLRPGRMYRGAVNRCVNLLIHYPEGCSANCAYCGLAKKRPGEYTQKSFIQVDWPIYSLDEVILAIRSAPIYVKRTCISMITHGKCRDHTLRIARRLAQGTPLPISVLLCPTITSKDDLMALRDAGVDKVGIALDLATPELFEQYRGRAVRGPHRWDHYWETVGDSLDVFGHPHVGVHLMVGMGETEQEMISLMDRLWGMGVVNHLFSFFAEKGSPLATRPQPPWPSYLRIQLARYLIEEGLSRYGDMSFDEGGRCIEFGLSSGDLEKVIALRIPFMITGCLGPDGKVACNRPFGNCLPDVMQWNYPYLPNEDEIRLIEENLGQGIAESPHLILKKENPWP